MNSYLELKNKQQNESNSFPFGFAFDKKQFKEMMGKWELTENDIDKILYIGGGAYLKKEDKSIFDEMFARHKKEREEAITSDKKGNGYIYEMFKYELANHEYGYTQELDETLDAVDLTCEQVRSNPNLLYGLNKALKDYGSWQLH